MRRILVIRRDNIGDLACSTPLIAGLRSLYPTARLDALVNSYNRAVLADNPHLDHLYAYTKAKHRGKDESVLSVHLHRLALFWQLRRNAYDLAVLAGDGNVTRQLRFARLLAARQTLGFAAPGSKLAAKLTLSVLPADGGHEVERSWSLLGVLGALGKPPAMEVRANDVVKEQVLGQLVKQGFNPESPTIAVHISARRPKQRWSAERFAELLPMLYQRHGNQILLLWAPGKEDDPHHPGDDCKASTVLSTIRKTNPEMPLYASPSHRLEQLIAGLSLSHLLICADGGAMHIAAGLGLPIVCLFGDADAERWAPWGVPCRVIQSETNDVAAIDCHQVLSAFSELYAGLKPSS